jgi:hypothetical protein
MSRLRDEAAAFITAAGLHVVGHEIQVVSGYWKSVDCYRFEINDRWRVWGCWLTLSQFVKECKQDGGAWLDTREGEIWSLRNKPVDMVE